MIVDLTEMEWVQLLNAASLASFKDIAPIMQKVSEQLTKQKYATPPETNTSEG